MLHDKEFVDQYGPNSLACPEAKQLQQS